MAQILIYYLVAILPYCILMLPFCIAVSQHHAFSPDIALGIAYYHEA